MADYGDIETLYLEKLRELAAFGQNNSSRGDWSQRNNGKAEQYAILKPGNHIHTWDSIGGMGSGDPATRKHLYRTVIQLWQKHRHTDGAAAVALEQLESDVRNHFDVYRKLGDVGGSVRDADIIETREMFQIPADGPEWLMVELVGECDDEESITFAE
jgi:hypothetical protein